MKVLIVESDTATTTSLEKDLVEWGYEVVTANNGQEALKTLKTNEIRLAIIDWMMPKEDPAEICRKIRQEIQEREIKNIFIIMLTNKKGEFEIVRGLTAGADDYLIKPFNFLELKVHFQNGERIIELEDSCIKLASFDALTKLWKKSKIVEILEEELNRGWRQNQPTGVIMIDVDHFKKINDTHGHLIGDKVLAEVASRLKKFVRPYDKAGRYGGDEMLIVLPHCNLNDIKQISERLRCSVCEKQIMTETSSLTVTISLGGTYSNNTNRASGNSLIQASDKALYLAKKQGRNCVVVAESVPFRVEKKL